MENRKLILGRFATGIFGLLIAGLMVGDLHAQVAFQALGGGQANDMKKNFLDQIARQKKSAEDRIASRIADIDRACQLTDKQKKKLHIASKGAIKAVIGATKAQLETQAKQMGFSLDDDEEEKEEGKEEEGEVEERAVQAGVVRFALNNVMMGGGSGPTGVEENKVWKSAIQKVLTEEQAKKLAQWNKTRSDYQIQVATGNFVAKVDRKLLLSAEQRAKLTEVIQREYGEKLRIQAASQDSNQFGGFIAINRMMGGQGMDSDDDERTEMVRDIFTESQLSEWNRVFSPQLFQLEQLAEGPNIAAPALINGAFNMVIEQAVEPEADDEDEDDDN